MIQRLWSGFREWGWTLFVVSMPITSMPLVIRLVGSDTVASPAVPLMAVLLAGWALPLWLKGAKLPRLTLPLLGFALSAFISCAAAFFLLIPPNNDISVLRSEMVALATLLVGMGFYFLTVMMAAGEGKIIKSLRLLNLAGFLVIVWCAAQAVAWRVFDGYPQWMRDFHDLYSRAPLFNNRVTGFALEPSWLANQLNLLFLPFWLAASVKRWSAFPWKFLRWFHVEDGLLAGGLVCLLLSLSRVGLLAFMLMTAFLALRLNLWLTRWIEGKLSARNIFRGSNEARRKRLLQILIGGGLVLFYLIAIVGLGVVLSRTDPRMEDLFNFSLGARNPILEYANSLNFSTRIVYWQAGWGTFNDFPWLGVGLGNAGYYFQQKLDPFAWELVEVRNLVYRSGQLLNTKCLWVRILAETGVVGFALFAAWLAVMWKAADALERTPQPLDSIIGLMGKLLIVALIMEGFSVDSFALPYIWFSLGLVTAAAWLNLKKLNVGIAGQREDLTAHG